MGEEHERSCDFWDLQLPEENCTSDLNLYFTQFLLLLLLMIGDVFLWSKSRSMSRRKIKL